MGRPCSGTAKRPAGTDRYQTACYHVARHLPDKWLAAAQQAERAVPGARGPFSLSGMRLPTGHPSNFGATADIDAPSRYQPRLRPVDDSLCRRNLKKKGPNEAFGPRLKTTGFPQPERLYACSSLAESPMGVNTCRLTSRLLPNFS
jgi:hypothetical protein